MKIIITIEGGVIQYVERLDADEVEVEVRDYDTDGCTKEEMALTLVDDCGDSYFSNNWQYDRLNKPKRLIILR